MNNHGMTNSLSLRVNRFLDQKWTQMPVFDQAGPHFVAGKPKMKFGWPSFVGGADEHRINQAFRFFLFSFPDFRGEAASRTYYTAIMWRTPS
jgi:hypothetical protein